MITFKDDPATQLALRLGTEFGRLDARLQVMLYALDGYVQRELHLPGITVTCLLRTPAENRAIYGDDRPSPHTDYRGADIRTADWPAGAADKACAWLVSRFSRSDRPVALFEGAVPGSTAPHLHLQVPAPRRAAQSAAFTLG